MWPPSGEGCFTRVDHVGAAGVLRCKVSRFGLDGCKNGPSASRGVTQVLLKGIVALLPSVQPLMAQETDGIVGVVGGRTEVETCTSELPFKVSLSLGAVSRR